MALQSLGETAPASYAEKDGGRYWIRTSDFFDVNEALYH